ncbi:MAG: helicase C-terminal domain-containing protein, partial [Anaerolineaceae bacterium]|nr:helicase C-terminal domain-containing protein [Anaerolineaceae bacterium]
VALDIETTGLDPSSDAILEIGAAKFSGRRVESEWSTLVNPGRPIPAFITQLTGITGEMVQNAPRLRDVLPDLIHFAGNAPILGHNIGFDLSFLRKYGALTLNESIDTYELAAILLPTATRYNLGMLAQSLGILLPATHRALDDARVAHAVYLQLVERANLLPIDLLAEFVRLSEPVEWGAGWIFGQMLRARIREQPVAPRKVMDRAHEAVFAGIRAAELAPLVPKDRPLALDLDECSALLDYGGPFANHFSGYEHRPQQVEMLRAVADAFSHNKHLLVEAGTGTGKSFAYLVPAALWAVKNNMRVVVSTNTINLQDQLIQKDIPDLCAALGLQLNVTVLKGRANYLCPRRLELMRQRGPENAEEMRVLAKVLVWMQESQSGDRSEINLNGPAERDVWAHLCAEDEGCRTEICIKRTGGACPFHRARQAAQSAHLLVVNHALLLADIATGSRVLPDYDYLIIDEGHHLESATTNALSFKVTESDMARLLRELGGPSSGVMGRYLNLTRDLIPPADYAALNQIVSRATDYAFRLENLSRRFFQTVDQFLSDQREGRPLGIYPHQERIQSATRTLPSWSEVEMVWGEALDSFKPLLQQSARLNQALSELELDLSEDLEDVQNSLGDLVRRLTEVQINLGDLVSNPKPDMVYWVEHHPSGNRLSLQVAPLHIGPLMEKYLWHEKSSVVLTSATLTTAGEFDYLRNRLNADEADELAVGSPFEYQSSAMLYLVNDIPEPSDANGHQRAIEHAIRQLAKATEGKMLVLFTSYAQLKRTSNAIGSGLAEAGILVYEQGEGASANTLLENFRGADRAVLLGTRSFWEGVDVPGDALSVLVIVKLPFDVPTEPIIAARSETFDDPFNEYNLPEAILRFRQGFGRLIRTQTDRGVVAVLDKRILTKRYGRSFLDSLPTCNVKVGPVSDLPRSAMSWLRK